MEDATWVLLTVAAETMRELCMEYATWVLLTGLLILLALAASLAFTDAFKSAAWALAMVLRLVRVVLRAACAALVLLAMTGGWVFVLRMDFPPLAVAWPSLIAMVILAGTLLCRIGWIGLRWWFALAFLILLPLAFPQSLTFAVHFLESHGQGLEIAPRLAVTARSAGRFLPPAFWSVLLLLVLSKAGTMIAVKGFRKTLVLLCGCAILTASMTDLGVFLMTNEFDNGIVASQISPDGRQEAVLVRIPKYEYFTLFSQRAWLAVTARRLAAREYGPAEDYTPASREFQIEWSADSNVVTAMAGTHVMLRHVFSPEPPRGQLPPL